MERIFIIVSTICNLKIHQFLCIYMLISSPLSGRLFGDDVGRHHRLTVLVLGFTDVVSKVDGLHVFYSHDALGDACSVAHPPVNQPPGGVDVNRTAVLNNITNMIYCHYVICWC